MCDYKIIGIIIFIIGIIIIDNSSVLQFRNMISTLICRLICITVTRVVVATVRSICCYVTAVMTRFTPTVLYRPSMISLKGTGGVLNVYSRYVPYIPSKQA